MVARRKAVDDLEWQTLLDALADMCAGDTAARRMRARQPAADRAEAAERVRRTAAALDAVALAQPIPAQATPDITATLAFIDKGGAAGGVELREIARVIAQARALRSYAQARKQDVAALVEILHSDPAIDPLGAQIERAIDEDGAIADNASPALRAARQRVRQLRRGLLDKLAQLSARYGDVLRDGSHVERDGRFGLPVRADAHRKVEGIVLGSSATGATLYVEPPAITALSNEMRIAEDDVAREEARVLAELSAAAAAHAAALLFAFDTCVEADVLAALGRWASQCRGIALAPSEAPELDLRRMRHPLLVLQGGAVVPSDLLLSSGSALVISGPNAGGKTVALKCLGLAVWMAQSGIPLPVQDGSRIGWFDRVLTDIGDEQSIARSLSTFSAHVHNLAGILEAAGAQSLVLLDEIAGGTDPEEGAALAAATLEALVDRGAAVAVTTHYERLKELAAEDARFRNASVGFDFEQMQPTFALTLGVPGPSSALAVASRHGLPAAVIARARALMSAPSLQREELLARLQHEHEAAADATARARADAEAARALKAELEAQRAIVRDKERKKLERERDDVIDEVRRARGELRAMLERARRGSASDEALREAERAADAAARTVAAGAPLDRLTREAPPTRRAPSLEVGMKVWVQRLGSVAEIVEGPDRGHVRVQAGAFALRVPVEEVRLPETSAERRAAKKKPRPAPPAASRASAVPAIRTSHNTCDVRGQRVDEALNALDRFVDELSQSAPEDPGFVLHGHGTGALKRAVREHLSASARIDRARPAEQEEGGDAFTVFWLR